MAEQYKDAGVIEAVNITCPHCLEEFELNIKDIL